MSDIKYDTAAKVGMWHRPWLPKWLLRSGRGSGFSSPSKHRKGAASHDMGDSRANISFPQTPRPDTAAEISLSDISSAQAYHRDGRQTVFSGNRRAVSAERRVSQPEYGDLSLGDALSSRLSAPEIQWDETTNSSQFFDAGDVLRAPDDQFDSAIYTESLSPNEENFKHILETELDKIWILNLSLRFRDGSDREKFFVTYVETPSRWRRVTVSCNYSRSEPGSLERDLSEQSYQGEKNIRIYEAIRESISQIQFFNTVTNLRLETIDGQLHVNVAEDANEIIPYPEVSTVSSLGLPLIPENLLTFEAHFSGFAYQVKYDGKDYVKKEMPGPDSVDEFLYEINALCELLGSQNVVQLKAIIVDDDYQVVKGLLLHFAAKGDLAGLLDDGEGGITWHRRERWARQIVGGLAEIHEAGFVQGDLTLTNIVVDEQDDAKVIDINRRGCPIGWEPPEFKKKLENKQRISMYIGVKSDLFQLGMILWALAMEVDQPERYPRPLSIPGHAHIPDYYKDLVQICLSERPQDRLSAKELLDLFPQGPIPAPPELAARATEYTTMHPIHRGLPNGTIYPHEVPDYSDGFVDNTDLAGVLKDPEEWPHTSSRSGFLNFHNDASIHFWNSHVPNHDRHVELDADSSSSLVSPEENLVEESSLAANAGPASTQGHVTGNTSNSLISETGEHIGSPSSCLPYTGSMTSFREHTQPATSCASIGLRDDADQPLNDATSGNVTFETAKTEKTIEATSPSVTNGTDLMSSSLPINPAFVPEPFDEQPYNPTPHDSEAIEPLDERRPSCAAVPRLRRVTFLSNLNDLFTSHLPINPRHNGQAETIWEHPHGDTASSFSYESEMDSPIPNSILPSDTTFPNCSSSSSDTCSLFASALPINPAMRLSLGLDTTTIFVDAKHNPRAPSLPDVSGSLFESILPINPAMTILESTHQP